MSTWVFLRGLTRESRHWGEFPAIFGERFPGARIHALDLPGNGKLHAETSPGFVEEMAEHCRRQLLGQGIDPPYHLLALSLGAMVAVAWAARHPGEIHGCVLVNTSLRPFSPFYQRLRPGTYISLLRLLMQGHDAEARERAILGLTSRRGGQSAAVLADWVAYRREYPVSSRNALRQLLAAARYRAPRTRPACPILLLASHRDALVDPLCSRRLARQWQTELVEHPSAGHDLPLDDGAWVAAQVGRWLP